MYYTNGRYYWKKISETECLAVIIPYGGLILPAIRIVNAQAFCISYRAADTKEVSKEEFCEKFDEAMNLFIGMTERR